ncbi:MAG: hypothetical protein AAF718_12355 [Pseudomonadota bacterium]
MSKDKLNLFLNTLRENFLRENWDAACAAFNLPLVIYSDAGVVVLRREEQLLSMLCQYRKALGKTEVAARTLEVEHRDVPTNQRLRATVRFTDFGENGQKIRHSLIRYFLLEGQGSYKIEMVEFIETSLPMEDVQRIIH